MSPLTQVSKGYHLKGPYCHLVSHWSLRRKVLTWLDMKHLDRVLQHSLTVPGAEATVVGPLVGSGLSV